MKRTFSSDELVEVCVKLGWQLERQRGSHMVFVRPGEPRPIVLQQGESAMAPFIVSNICRQLGVTKAGLRDLL